MNFSHRQLKAFLAVADLRNFSRAAERLHIAQSGLSQMIRELEAQLGFRLFNRSTRQVALTEFGEEFLAVAAVAVRDLESVVARVGRDARQARTTLSVGAPPLTCAYLLPGVAMAFNRMHPEVRLSVLDTDLEQISSLVREGRLDVGMGMFVRPTAGVLRRPLCQPTLVAVSAAAGFEVGAVPRRWEELAGLPLITLPAGNPLQQFIDRQLLHCGGPAEPRYVVNFIETQLGLAAAGAGTAIVPSTAVAACLGRRLRLDPVGVPAVCLTFYEVRDRMRQLPECADDFCALASEAFSRSVALP